MKVLVPYNADWVQTIEEIIGSNAEVVRSSRTIESMIEHGKDADVIASGRVPGEFIHAATNLKLIHAIGAGIDKIDLEVVRERGGIIVCNSHVNAAEVAEYAISLLFAVAKNLIVNDRAHRMGDWKYAWGGPTPNIEIRNKTCLLVGLGNIGSEIAKRLRCFDARITAVTRTGETSRTDLIDDIASISSAEALVRDADFVILSLPLTHKSEGVVNKEFISWMKPSTIFVNISRGEIVDEAALYYALKENRIHGAGLDVWWNYPEKWGGTGKQPSENYPFHELENVVVSPHRAAYSESIVSNQAIFLAENILRFIKGEKPQNIIDLNLEY